MDRAVKSRHQRVKFSVTDSDWVEWLIVGLLCVSAAVGVGFTTGSLLSALVAVLVLFGAGSAVIALV